MMSLRQFGPPRDAAIPLGIYSLDSEACPEGLLSGNAEPGLWNVTSKRSGVCKGQVLTDGTAKH